MLPPHVIKHRKRIRHEARLGGPPAAAAITAIVDEIQRTIRQRRNEGVYVPSHVLRIAAEVEERPGPWSRHDPDFDPLA